MDIKESDRKIYKKLRPLALQRYCKWVINDVDKILHQEEGSDHERYLEMYKIVFDADKRLARMFNGFSRSKALNQLVMFRDSGLLNDDELSQLSSETRKIVLYIR